jgi:Tfp pilus assembly protein FimT
MVEIVITVAIVGILVMMAVSSFKELSEKYGIEAETKQFYTDLMSARGRALQRNRYHFVRITSSGYAIYEDTNPLPDGNRAYDATLDNQVVNVTLKHPVTSALTGGAVNFEFNRHGIASATDNILLSPMPGYSVNPDYDCITIRETRINTGRFSAGACVEK